MKKLINIMCNLKSEIVDGATNLNTISKQNMLFISTLQIGFLKFG